MSKREAIKQAFRELIAEPDRIVTPSAIAKKARVSRATFYNNFDNCTDLLTVCYEDLRQDFIAKGNYTLDIFLSFFKDNHTFFQKFLYSRPFCNLLADFLGPQDYGNFESPDGDPYQAADEVAGINGILFTWAADACTSPIRAIRRAILSNQNIEEYPSSSRFILCNVDLHGGTSDRNYTLVYLSNNPHIKVGDTVAVPIGIYNRLAHGIVEAVRFLPEKELPLPLYKIKYIAEGPVDSTPRFFDAGGNRGVDVSPCGNPKL
jgi:AcrR family transcriptional regulator